MSDLTGAIELIRELRAETQELCKQVDQLRAEKKTCYECEKPAHDLSPRSRCCDCEHRRALFNEKENETLRAEVEIERQRANDLAQESLTYTCQPPREGDQ